MQKIIHGQIALTKNEMTGGELNFQIFGWPFPKPFGDHPFFTLFYRFAGMQTSPVHLTIVETISEPQSATRRGQYRQVQFRKMDVASC